MKILFTTNKLRNTVLLILCLFTTHSVLYANSVEQKLQEQLEQYIKACSLDTGRGCSNLGLMYQDGKGVLQSNTKALRYYAKACNLRVSLGCELYAKLKIK